MQRARHGFWVFSSRVAGVEWFTDVEGRALIRRLSRAVALVTLANAVAHLPVPPAFPPGGIDACRGMVRRSVLARIRARRRRVCLVIFFQRLRPPF